MSLYSAALASLEQLLERAAETRWSNWVAEDRRLWKQRHDVAHHLSAYGGMGSLNDLILRVNRRTLTARQEPWVTACLQELLDIAYTAARSLGTRTKSYGREPTDASRRRIAMQGRKCLACGKRFVSRGRVLEVAAQLWAHSTVAPFLRRRRGRSLVAAAFAGPDQPEGQTYVDVVSRTVRGAGIRRLPARFQPDQDACPVCRHRRWATQHWHWRLSPIRLVEN